jgi:hypothetical protein
VEARRGRASQQLILAAFTASEFDRRRLPSGEYGGGSGAGKKQKSVRSD